MANNKIGTKLVIEGEKEYRDAIKNINIAQKELRSELKLLSTEFNGTENSEEALEKKSEVLTKQIDSQQKKVETYTKAVEASQKVQDDAGKTLESANDKYKAACDKLELMTKSSDTTKEALAEQQAVVKDLGDKVQIAQTKYDAAQRSTQSWQTSLNASKSDLNLMNQSLEENTKYLDEAKSSNDKTATSIDGFGKSTQEAKEKVDSTSESIDQLSQVMADNMIVDSAKKISEGLKECVEAADQFQYAMAKVQSIALTDDASLGQMKTDIKNLAVEYGISANDIAEATYQAISASVDAKEATSFVADAAKLARGGFTDITSAVDIMTTVTNAYGKEANSTAHIMDSLIETQNLGKTTVNDLAESMGTVIPTASAFGVNLDNISAAYIQMTKNGINTANATTMLNGMLSELADTGSAVSKTLVAETGSSFSDLMKSGKSLGDVIQILGDSVDGDSVKFANLWGNIRAGRGAVTIFNNGADAFNKSLDSVKDSAGACNTAFETMADTSEMTNQRMDAAVENLKTSIGDALQPTIDAMKDSAIDALEAFNGFVEDNPALVTALAGATTAVVGVTVAVGACAVAVNVLKLALGDVQSVAITLGAAAVAGGIAGLATGVMNTANAADSASAAMAKEISAARSLNSSISDAIDKRKESNEQLNASEAATAALVNRLKELDSTSNRTNAVKSEELSIVTQLNQQYPELNLELDKEDKLTKESTENLDKKIKKLEEEARAKAAQADLEEIAKNEYDTQKEIYELTEQQTEAQKNLADAEQAAADSLGTAYYDENSEAVEKARKSYNDLGDQITKTKENLSDLGKEEDTTRGFIESDTSALNENSGAASDNAAATQQLSQEQQDAAKEYAENVDKAIESMNSERDTFQELGEKIRTGSDDQKTSIDKVKQSFEDQKTAMVDYAKNVAWALEFMKDPDHAYANGLLSSIIQQGPSASGELSAIKDAASGSKEEMQKFLDTCKLFSDTSEITEGLGQVKEAMSSGYVDGLNEARTNVESTLGSMNETFTTNYGTQLDDLQKHNDDMKATTSEGITSMAQSVTDGTTEVTTATQNMLTSTETATYTKLGMSGANTNSTVYYNIGKTGICGSLAKGISDGTSSVSAAIKSMCEKAVSSVDISGLVKKIDTKLGSKIGG